MIPSGALIVEDMPQTRAWLIDLVQRAFPACHVREAETLTRARAELEQRPELLLVDLNLPDGDGVELVREAKERDSDVLCIVATVMSDDGTVVAALAAGADGYLLKETEPEIIVHQLRQAADGSPALSPQIARRIMEHFRRTGPVDTASDLTERERDVLGLIGRGLRTAEVARDLGLAESTVAGYIKTVYRKLGISSRAEAAWHATRLGLGRD